MSGHSKWHTIKNKKGAIDAQRGKVFTLHAKLIEIAAKKGGDPGTNPGLRTAIDKAKADNVPNANIEKAIRRGTGEDKEGTILEELTYESFGPAGTVFMIDAITDNKNRTFANLRTLISKHGGNIGAAGSVGWKFNKRAYFLVDAGGKNPDEAEMAIIDAGADDLKVEGSKYEVYAHPDKLGEVRTALNAAGFKIEKDELIWQAKEDLKIADLETAKKIIEFINIIEGDDDVKSVSGNVDFEESLLVQL